MKKLIEFIDTINPKLKFHFFENLIYYSLSIVYMPVARHAFNYFRMRKFDLLRRGIYDLYPPQFFGDQGSNKTIRFDCCKDDYQLAYIDFLDFSRKEENWPGVKLPTNILLAGSGTFDHPFSL